MGQRRKLTRQFQGDLGRLKAGGPLAPSLGRLRAEEKITPYGSAHLK